MHGVFLANPLLFPKEMGNRLMGQFVAYIQIICYVRKIRGAYLKMDGSGRCGGHRVITLQGPQLTAYKLSDC